MGWEGLLVREVWLPMLNIQLQLGQVPWKLLPGLLVVGWGRCMAMVWWGVCVQSRWVARVKPITVEVRSSTIRADED